MADAGGSEQRPGTALTALIRARRSVRTGYLAEPVDVELEEIVACGLTAPSSKNSMPWRLHVVTDRDLLVWVADTVTAAADKETFVPHDPATGEPRPEYSSTVVWSADVLREAPAAVFIENLGPFSRGIEGLLDAGPERVRASMFGFSLEMIGIGTALENMWLAANALGLSAAYLGDLAIAGREIGGRLDVTGDVLGALAVGRSADRPVPPMDRPALLDTPRVRWHRRPDESA